MSNVKLSRKELGRKGATPPHSPNKKQEQQQQQQQRNESLSLSSSLTSRSNPASPDVNSKTKKKRSLLKHSASKILRGSFLKKKKQGRNKDDHAHDPFLTRDESESSLDHVSTDTEEDGSIGLTQIKLPPLATVTSMSVEEVEAVVEPSVEPMEEGESRTKGLPTDEQKEIEKEGGEELLHGWAEEEDAGLDGTRRKIPLYLLNPDLDVNDCIKGGVKEEKGMFRVVSKVKIEEEETKHDLTKDEESKHETDGEDGESRTKGLPTDEQKEIEKEGGEALHGWAEEEDAGLDGTRRKIPLYLLNPDLDINGCIRGGVEKDKEKGMFRVVSKIKIEEEETKHDLTKDEESKHETDETTRLPADNDSDEKVPNPSHIISDDTSTRHRSQPHPTEKSVITSGGGFFRTQFVMAALFLVAVILTSYCSKDSFATASANWSS